MSTTVKYDGVIVATTPLAIGLGEEPGDEVVAWVPKSVIHYIDYDGMGQSHELWKNMRIRSITMEDWFVDKFEEKLE